jgi:glycosyl transferase family 2
MRGWLRNAFGRARAAPAQGRIIALTATRNDDWILGLSLRASLSYCDAVVLTDHRSSAATAEIVRAAQAEFPGVPIDVRRDEREHFMEADVRQEMLERARALGGTHCVVVDADELPTANLLPRLRSFVLGAGPGQVIALPMISPYHSEAVYRWDGKWGADNRIPWSFADAQQLRWQTADGYQLHWRMPHGALPARMPIRGRRHGGLFHLQFASLARLRCKAVWYKMSETLRYPGKRTAAELNRMYDWTLAEQGRVRRFEVPAEWWSGYRERGWLAHYRPADAPWQLTEIRQMLERHGRGAFAGIDFHGVA